MTIDHYATDYSALEPNGYVSQGAADYCAAHGHASYIVDGVPQGYCPRCLTVTHPVSTTECAACGQFLAYDLNTPESNSAVYEAWAAHQSECMADSEPEGL